ncbi:hypothetical protein CBW55_22390 [Yersinia intermedia]|nr:hypothetical protein CBW55_22390 [Yersinia intermedia]
MDGWQQILTGTGDITLTAPDNTTVVISSMSKLTNWVTDLQSLGIGLPSMTGINNFDFQTFVFTSGANYAVYSSTWLNVPVEVVYPTGIIISITVISAPGSNVILKLVPHVSSGGEYNTYYVRMSGAAGSRTIYVTQDWNSANPIPLSGGGLGATTAAGAIATLGLGEGSLAPIGVPLPYPLATPPAGFLKCNGSSFSTAEYPKLALAYPSGVLPDLRGEFIRGWDDGRGADIGRSLLSSQSGSIVGKYVGGYSDKTIYNQLAQFDSMAVTSATWSHISSAGMTSPIMGQESGVGTRPRNIAFNYIVRAA